ncbi:hypothetical protein GGH98_003672, partial [Coemansia sp. RSA 454]
PYSGMQVVTSTAPITTAGGCIHAAALRGTAPRLLSQTKAVFLRVELLRQVMVLTSAVERQLTD